jgi:myosin heavy subunit
MTDKEKAAAIVYTHLDEMMSPKEYVATANALVTAIAKALHQARQDEQSKLEEREAAVCPEDVGFEEYVQSLEKKYDQLLIERRALGLQCAEREEEASRQFGVLAEAVEVAEAKAATATSDTWKAAIEVIKIAKWEGIGNSFTALLIQQLEAAAQASSEEKQNG